MNTRWIPNYLRYGFCLLAGIFTGWIFFHSSPKTEKNLPQTDKEIPAEIWTCAMHPQIRMPNSGKCPLCAMDLILIKQNTTAAHDSEVLHLSKEAAQLANVMTSAVTSEIPVKEIRLYGKVQADERLLQSQVAHISGRIEKLMLNFTGEPVSKGQTLALIYSPELVTAQQELLEAAKIKITQPEIYEAAKDKLRQWKLTDEQISLIENSESPANNFEVVSNTNGIVTARRVNNGDHVAQGTVLYDIADLSHLWIMFDAYESDIEFLKTGDPVTFTVQALPGALFTGDILFIDPVLDPVTRVAKVRVEIANKNGKLKPEMFAIGVVRANLEEYNHYPVIPSSAVLWTGKRSIVYVRQPGDEPVFKLQEIELGPMLGDRYIVIKGLKEGEKIVTQGAFSVDASAQLEGKPSMMNLPVEKPPASLKPAERPMSSEPERNSGHSAPSP